MTDISQMIERQRQSRMARGMAERKADVERHRAALAQRVAWLERECVTMRNNAMVNAVTGTVVGMALGLLFGAIIGRAV